jgi:hypothetical protein
MLGQVVVFFISPSLNFNLYEWVESKSMDAFDFLNYFMYFIFFFSLLNIPVIAGTGISFLYAKKGNKSGILYLIAACSYFYYGLQVGKDF